MPRFEPEEILRTLERQGVRYVLIGGVAATIHGSPLITRDTDICPARDATNLAALAVALREMHARIRTGQDPEGVAFPCDAAFLGQMTLLNLVTAHGDLDLSFVPSGTGGYDDLRARAVEHDLGDGLRAAVATLEDVIRSKEAANRAKDRAALPTLHLLLERKRSEPRNQ